MLQSLTEKIKRNARIQLSRRVNVFNRESIAARYLSGSGIEIGALAFPLATPPQAHVTFVDRMTVPDLMSHYPELKKLKLVDVDVVDNGERLDKFSDGSQDFVIANHFIEHCENPILAIQNMLRVLRTGGTLYVAMPDKRFTFDQKRSVTSFEHLMEDYQLGTERSRWSHYEEYAHLVDNMEAGEQTTAHATQIMEKNYSIHFHVWTQHSFLEMLLSLKSKLSFPFEIDFVFQNGSEFIIVLKKSPSLQ